MGFHVLALHSTENQDKNAGTVRVTETCRNVEGERRQENKTSKANLSVPGVLEAVIT